MTRDSRLPQFLRLRGRLALVLLLATVTNGIALAPASAVARLNTSITLNANDYQAHKIFQRDGSDRHTFGLRGTITGPCAAVEASFAGQPFATIHNAPGTEFAGSLVALTGQGSLTVRCSNNRGLVASIDGIGVGDVYVVAGQSNAEGHGIHAQSYSTIAGNSAVRPTVFTEGDQWKVGDDHTDIHGTTGSVWPIVGGYVVANTSVPVAFITTATGGSKLVWPTEWQPGGAVCPTVGANCYDNMVQQVADAGVNGVKAVLWLQGEGDARRGRTQADYNAALDQLAANIRADLPGSPPLVAGVIGPWIYGRGAGTDNIRYATMEAWADNLDVLAGPQAYDIRITGDGFFDDLHFATDDEFQTLGYRWWKALDAHFYSRADGRGPVATGAVIDAERTAIDVTFSDASGLSQSNSYLSAWAWIVSDGGRVVTVRSASVVSSTVARLVLASPVSLSGTVSVTLAQLNMAEGALVPRDASTGNVGLGPSELPADPFRDLVATRSNVSPGACSTNPVGLGSLGFGVAATDRATGSGFVMYSEESVFSRFVSAQPFAGSAEHFVVVVFDADTGVWRYDRNGRYVVFSPRSSDVLVAGLDFTSDLVSMLGGQGSTSFGGVTLGYATSDLVVTANRWNGQVNAGEFELVGQYLCV